ncbi:pentatricopeptide repeat-containing protein At3g26630, chloroplastic [Alnus glutinosa]|uniref:pentatricopeptide repeat-containing protein At3g26630, chloroplastic n=1 Tax=Alnus glutinosa TaxID=3517 RepID=UPI002D79B09C|nr:pentatricopeptide repeat-containing protein At3g26630, chloroplastic [Alnus glutinosa]XP_062151785.1 pentatricopeptide repeat-containing protein At3g26630, chloroplastic [Alnus glutinosa]
MVACLSCTSDALPKRNPLPSSRIHFGSQEAFISLQKCTTFKQLKQIHAKIVRHGLSHDQLLTRRLLHLCSSHGKMDYATLLFHQIKGPLTFTWNVMIRAYTFNGCAQQALLLFNLMISQGFPPDKYTFPFVVKACSTTSVIGPGKVIHGLAIKTGSLGDMFALNTLMDLYFKCGNVEYGCKIFEKMRVRNVVSWTTMVSGLVACGEVNAARGLFEQMPTKNVVSWTAMINGYVRNRPEEAFELFWRMQLDNVRPNEFTLISLLKACTEIGSLKMGRWIHDFALKNGFKLGIFLGTALIDMYSKCGNLEDARRVFDEMQIKSLVTWNSMITSLGVHGRGHEAIGLFAEMERANVRPDAITFVGVLCACVQTENLEEAQRYFKCMVEHYGITPVLEHLTCMIELYSRADMLDEVCELVNAMPAEPKDNILSALLRESKVYGIANMEIFLQRHAGKLDC